MRIVMLLFVLLMTEVTFSQGVITDVWYERFDSILLNKNQPPHCWNDEYSRYYFIRDNKDSMLQELASFIKVEDFYPLSVLYTPTSHQGYSIYRELNLNKTELDFKVDLINDQWISDNPDDKVGEIILRKTDKFQEYLTKEEFISHFINSSSGCDFLGFDYEYYSFTEEQRSEVLNSYWDLMKNTKTQFTTIRVVDILKYIKSSLDQSILDVYRDESFSYRWTPDEIKNFIDHKEVGKIIILERSTFDPLLKNKSNQLHDIKGIGINFISNENDNDSIIWVYYPQFEKLIQDSIYSSFEGQYYPVSYLIFSRMFENNITRIERGETVFFEYNVEDGDWMDWYFLYFVLDEFNRDLPEITPSEREFLSYVKEKSNYLDIELDTIESSILLTLNEFDDNSSFNLPFSLGSSKIQFNYKSTHSVKSVFNFSDGLLDGKQLLYYEDGSLYSEFYVDQGEITWIKRFYRDGSLIESGELKNKIKYGIWDYNLKIPNDLNIETSNSDYWKFDYSTNTVNFRIEYLTDPSPVSFQLVKIGVSE